MKKISRYFFLFFVPFLVSVTLVVDSSKAEDNNTSSKSSDIVKVTPDDLCQDYKDNEIAANQNCKNKHIEIKSVISGFNKNYRNSRPYVFLVSDEDTDDEFPFQDPPNAQLAASEIDKLSTLKEGQKITLFCKDLEVSGAESELKDCVIQ